MKILSLLRLTVPLIVLLASPAAGQEPQLTAQDALALARRSAVLHERSSWRVEFLPTDKPVWNVKSITSTRTGSLQRDVIVWNSGKTSEAWRVDGDYLADDPRDDTLLFTRAKAGPGELGWISWISEGNFRGIEKRDKTPCVFFEDKTSWQAYWPGFFTGGDAGGGGIRMAAWFAAEDGRLVALRVEDSPVLFTWLEPPAEPLALPDRFAEKLKKIRERIARKFPHLSAP